MRGCLYAAAATSFQKLTTTTPTWAPVRVNRVSHFHGLDSFSPPEIQIGVLKSQTLVRGCTDDGFLPNFVSIRRNPLLPFASSESQVELEIANEDKIQTQSPDKDNSPEVHIRLELQRECQFGGQFLVAGDHMALGLWNPIDAAPMVWSDGHVWTADLELPAGKLIQFKFIFRDISGEILWQPGPNRVLQTQETSKVTVVCGDWETVAVQQVTEIRMIRNEKHLTYDEGESNNKNERPRLEKSYVSNITSLNGEALAMVAENVELEIPVLVPGLTPCLITPAATEEEVQFNAFDDDRNSIEPENQIQLDSNKEEMEGRRENEEELEVQEHAVIEPNNGLQLTLYEGHGNRKEDHSAALDDDMQEAKQ
ncbi:hypothetical protein V2J09_009452 [Rumex salicifolius]